MPTIDLGTLSSAQGFIIHGAVADDSSGGAVSGAGDFNGDGFADIVIGADGANPNGRSSAGESYVIFGKATGFSTIDLLNFTSGVNGFIIQGAGTYDFIGNAVSGAGDINSDGYADIIIGASGANPGYVIFGKATGFSTIDLLNFTSGVNGFIIQGVAGGSYTGTSVSKAGDVNGDGYADIIIGARSVPSNGRMDSGESYVIFGKVTGFSTIDLASFTSGVNGFIIQGAAANDWSGGSVSGAGDFNGDGYADIIIGADGANPNGRSNAGESYVIFGKASGFSTIDLASFTSGVNGFIIQGAATYDASGIVSGAGDFNGDGYADIIIGAFHASPNSRAGAGEGYVIFGKASGFSTIDLLNFTSGVNGFVIQGAVAGDLIGIRVSGSGDINSDGYADIIISSIDASPNNRLGAGASYVIFGKATGFSTIDLLNFASGVNGFVIQGAVADDQSGSAVSGAGDINGDGYADIIIGAVNASPSNRTQAGESYMIFGGIQQSNNTYSHSASHHTPHESATPIPQHSHSQRSTPHEYATIDLGTLSIPQGLAIQGAVVGDNSGMVSGAGDVNGDGYADIIIGAKSASPNGRSDAGEGYVMFGKANGFNIIDLASFTSGVNGFIIQGAVASGYCGIAVSGAGDINGDGYADVIISARGAAPNGRAYAGESYVIFGKASGASTIDLLNFASGINGFIIQGAVAYDWSGSAVSGAGDVNGDGYADIIIGASNASPNGRFQAGESYVIFGKATGFSTIDLASFTSGINGFIIQGAVANDWSGIAASGAGDINGDGYADIIIGAPYRGKSYVIFGKASGFSTIDLLNFTSGVNGFAIQGGGFSGAAVSGTGDVNGDGYADIIIGAFYAAPNGRSNAGASYVIFGKATGFSAIDLASFTSGVNGFIIQGAVANDLSGAAVSGAGDVNGDGYADIIIGAHDASPNGRTTAGESYVIFGKATGFSTIDLASFTSGVNGFIIQGAAANDASGDAVSGAGDVNGDGIDDIIVGGFYASPSGRNSAGESYVIFGGPGNIGNTYSHSTAHQTPHESATPISNPGGTSSSSTDLPTIIGAVVGGICAAVALVAAAVFIKNKNAAGAAAAITTIQMNEVKAFFTEDKTKPAEQEECTELCGEIIQDPLSYEC